MPLHARLLSPVRCDALSRLALALSLTMIVSACAELPTVGPNRRTVQEAADTTVDADVPRVAVIDVDESVVRHQIERQRHDSFATSFGQAAPAPMTIGQGDALEVTLWEAPPATLFLPSNIDARVSNTAGTIVLPVQVVDRTGSIRVPFAGRVEVVGKTIGDVADEIAHRLEGKANHPQAIVRIVQNASSTVDVVGEVANNVRMPLTPGGERLLDALAAAGGSRQPVGKTTLQLTRGGESRAMPLDRIVRDPSQNVSLRPGDVLTVLSQPCTFTVLGASGRQQESPLEAEGISLAQALGRAGGLLDSRADPAGVFVFRFESPADVQAITGGSGASTVGSTPVSTASGGVPVIYRLDLRNPRSFFAMQDFTVRDRDIVYISNAPSTDLQKLLNLIFAVNRQVVYTINQ